MMRHVTIVLVLILGQSCSTEKAKEKQGDGVSNPPPSNDKDKFETEDKVFFKQYINDQGNQITEQQKVTFAYGSGRNKESVFIVSKLNSQLIGGWQAGNCPSLESTSETCLPALALGWGKSGHDEKLTSLQQRKEY